MHVFRKKYSICTCAAVLKYGKNEGLQAMGSYCSKNYLSIIQVPEYHQFTIGLGFLLCGLGTNYMFLSFIPVPSLYCPMGNSPQFWIKVM